MAITTRINRLIEESACLNVRLADRLKGSGLDFLIWASPSSCRSPEETKLWHPFYARKSFFIKIGIYLYILALYSLVGIIRFFSYKGFYFSYFKKGKSVLLIIPDEITDHTKFVKTDYLIESHAYEIDKLVFSRFKKIGPKFCKLTYFDRAEFFSKLFLAASLDFKEKLQRREINTEYLDAFIIFLRWIISQSWCFHWDFYHLVEEVSSSDFSNYEAMLCLHEMHFYSKVVWRVAKMRKMRSITAQHAMIIPEKLWYFPHEFEVKADCPIPDIFFVYSDEIKNMLLAFYPGTRFLLCCSPRFNRWKSEKEDSENRHTKEDWPSVLFVSGIMPYDVTLLMEAIKNLLREKEERHPRIKLRLHPYGNINRVDKFWIRLFSKSKEIEVSKASLKDDLSKTSLVIGANSTVLQEALILGIPALSIFNRDFVHPSILPDENGWKVSSDELSWNLIKKQSEKIPDNNLRDRFKRNLGIFSPDLTTRLIYETCVSYR